MSQDRKNWLSLLEEKIRPAHRKSVLSAADLELAKLRPSRIWWQRREFIFAMSGAALAVAGIFGFRLSNQTSLFDNSTMQALDLEDPEMVEDMDFFAELEFLETWDENEDV